MALFTYVVTYDRTSDTTVVIEPGDGSEEFSSGFDSPHDLQRLPAGYSGGVWTNRIDQIAPALARP